MNKTNYLFAGKDDSKKRIQLMKILIEYKYGNNKTTEECADIIMNELRNSEEK